MHFTFETANVKKGVNKEVTRTINFQENYLAFGVVYLKHKNRISKYIYQDSKQSKHRIVYGINRTYVGGYENSYFGDYDNKKFKKYFSIFKKRNDFVKGASFGIGRLFKLENLLRDFTYKNKTLNFSDVKSRELFENLYKKYFLGSKR